MEEGSSRARLRSESRGYFSLTPVIAPAQDARLSGHHFWDELESCFLKAGQAPKGIISLSLRKKAGKIDILYNSWKRCC